MRARSIAQAVELARVAEHQVPCKGVYRFLNQRALDLRQLLRSYFTPESTTEDDVIIVDDTPSKRCGRRMEGVSFVYSTTLRSSFLGYCLVTLYHYGTKISGFLDFELKISDNAAEHRPGHRGRPIQEVLRAKRKSRYELVLEMLDRARTLGNRARVLIFDSWYGAYGEFLWGVIQRGFHFITRLRKSRHLWFNGRYQKVKDIFPQLRKFRRLDAYTRYVAWQSSLVGVGDVWAILAVSTDRRGVTRRAAIVSDLLDWGPEKVLEFYFGRSRTEQGYKVVKQDLGLNEAHLGSFAGQINEMSLTFLAYLIASDVRLKLGGSMTIAQVTLRTRLGWAVWAKARALWLLWRRATKYPPETMISTSLVQAWISETMMTTGFT